MIRYLLTAILMVIIFMMIIVIESFLLKVLYLANSVSNYAMVIINGSRRLLNIP
ncbi:hypothetical protein [Vulcanisaeta distributa]|uniref:Uncharacterized protein n=1 Tax=Vulcanisaeta distributa (strain DSM 14429 / JCM 11212 / NBRC 100878 / IC-017) TaxID=572478 RepID=E1QR63_VULDI|nr:hypothetical protein [Vulcanisaeta distributa]ADN51753.1 hypothetical protein Vdis_2386 [Vulcanisaeta distributa DSM 14429]